MQAEPSKELRPEGNEEFIMAVKAVAKNIGISAKKMRRVVDLVRGQKVDQALDTLHFLITPSSKEVAKVIKSAANNAENNSQMSQRDLKIMTIQADEGPSLRRFRPRSRGRASRIIKRSCHVTVVVDEEEAR
jgi:large subunit ribosomal protein L22